MFNAHLYPSFHSLKVLSDGSDYGPSMLTTEQKTARLSLWRDSIVKDQDFNEIFTTAARAAWSKNPGMKKMSYLPTKLSKIAGIEAFFSGGKGKQRNIIIPSRYQQNKAKLRNQLFYLIPRDVTITYGPYFYLGILDYRLERLHGLQTALKLAGANTHLRPVQHIDNVSVWYLEKEIFTCKISELHHGGDGELDSLCYDAATAFTKQSRRAMLNVRHKYRFNKKKLATCPCHPGYSDNRFDDDDDDWDDDDEEEADEFVGEFDDQHSSYYSHELDGEGLSDDNVLSQLNDNDERDGDGNILRRISLETHQRIKFIKPSYNVEKPEKAKLAKNFTDTELKSLLLDTQSDLKLSEPVDEPPLEKIFPAAPPMENSI